MTDEKARETAKGLIQGYIGPDHKVVEATDERLRSRSAPSHTHRSCLPAENLTSKP